MAWTSMPRGRLGSLGKTVGVSRNMPPSNSPPSFEERRWEFPLRDRETGTIVVGRCIRLTKEIARERIDKIWWLEKRFPREAREQEPDRNWRWADLHGQMRSQKGAAFVRGWALETPSDGQIQSAIFYNTQAISARIRGQFGEGVPAVYATFLATAPRNRPSLNPNDGGRYRGAGTALLRLAVAHSYALGGSGRVVLKSVPVVRTLEWYERFGFVQASADPPDYNECVLLELPEEAASRHLREMGFP